MRASHLKLSIALALASLMLFGLQRPVSAANSDSCTAITAIPMTITAEGSYCLTKDIKTASTFTTGNGITINANNVTIDLGGHTLNNLPAGLTTTTTGIYAGDKKNITIQNGTIMGFSEAILLQEITVGGSSGHLVQNMRIERNTYAGISVVGTGSVIYQNQVLHTGGGTASGTAADGTGIYAGGNGVQVLENTVADTLPGAVDGGTGILLDSVNTFSGAVVEHNRVSTVGQPAHSVGIEIQTGAKNS